MASENILIADDSAEIRDTLADFLKSLDYRVQTAADGRKAAALINSHPFELVIADLQMPFVDGLGVLQAARARDADVPVIILTGHPTIESAIEALRQGAYSYLLKPVENLDELRYVVENALEHRRLTTENRRLLEELRVVNASLANRVAQQTQQLREAYEQLQSLDQMKAQFVSVTSHELRTPLAQFFFTADLLQGQLDQGSIAGAKTYLTQLLSQGQQLQRLIDNLLDFSQMDRDEFKLDLGECHVSELMRSTVELWRLQIEKKHLSLDVSLPERNVVLNADTPRLQHALGQLIDNAIKFTPPGGRIKVAAHGPTPPPWTQALQSSFAVIAVIDTGPGIPLEKQQAIFQAFTQTDMSDHRRYSGLGMGLAIASRIVLAHGGRITLNSEPGKGSMFAMWLPMRPDTSPFTKPR
jgi:signal transduction histidine kinase